MPRVLTKMFLTEETQLQYTVTANLDREFKKIQKETAQQLSFFLIDLRLLTLSIMIYNSS